MKGTERLLSATKDIRAAYNEHPFVPGTTDRPARHSAQAQIRRLEEIFVACSRYELAFWALAWNMSK